MKAGTQTTHEILKVDQFLFWTVDSPKEGTVLCGFQDVSGMFHDYSAAILSETSPSKIPGTFMGH